MGEIETHPVGCAKCGDSTGAMPGYLGPSNIGPQFRIVRIEDGKITWKTGSSSPSSHDGRDRRRIGSR